MQDGSHIAFFEDPASDFDFKKQHDFDLHLALEVEYSLLSKMKIKAINMGIETRGIIDHDFIHSIYFRDPNGYVIELTTPVEPSSSHNLDAKIVLDSWQNEKSL